MHDRSTPPPGIVFECDDHVLTLRMDRPACRNAVNAAMWTFFADALPQITADGAARCVVLTGGDGNFSAGADIAEFDTVRKDAATARRYEALNVAAFSAVAALPCPTIAAIDGICFGGAFGLAAACDLRLATGRARFAIPAARLGLAYPAASVAAIVAATGPQRAAELLYAARSFDGQAMRDCGFLCGIVGHEALGADALAMAQAIAANAPLSVAASKAAIRAAQTSAAADLEKAERLGAATFDSADYAEGRAAFREKRTPQFRGE